ncbi:MAG: NAD(+) synthase [Clostridia bacterium]|nr:NAD(+) synthase [Clostridia bacterium]
MDYVFDAARARDGLVEGVRRLAAQQGFTRVVVGISGGKDSTVSAAICARALGRENVYGVMLPDGGQLDIADSIRVCEALGINRRTVNIGAIHEALRSLTDQRGAGAAPGEFDIPRSRESDINVGPRLRMTVLRYIAQSLGARLVGTGNLSESTVGYCTKDGDTSCDFALLGALTSVEVVGVGLTMPEIPAELVEKTPTDGLSGKSDEERLGLTYADIHRYIRLGPCGDADTDARIRQKQRANAHKRRMPVIIDPFESEGGGRHEA